MAEPEIISLRLDEAMKNGFLSRKCQYLPMATLEKSWLIVGNSFPSKYEIDDLATKFIRYFSQDRQTFYPELKDNPYKGLRVFGKKGLGKSINFLIYQRMLRLLGKDSSHFRHYEMKEIEHHYKSRGHSFIEEIVNIPELALSDLGTEKDNIKDYGTDTSLIDDILSLRYIYFQTRNFTTHITTNMNNDMYGKRYGERHDDRANEMFINIKADGLISKRK